MEVVGLLASDGIQIAVTGVQLAIVVLLTLNYLKTSDMHHWHRPIATDEGEYFAWKQDRKQQAELIQEIRDSNQLLRQLLSQNANDTRALLDAMNRGFYAERREDVHRHTDPSHPRYRPPQEPE